MPAASTHASTQSSFLCTGLVRFIEPVAVSCANSLKISALLDLGPVPLPGKTSMQIERLSDYPGQSPEAASLKGRWKSQKTLSVSCFPLTWLSPDSLTRHLDRIHETSSVVLLADFKVAERNIEVPSCLLMAGLKLLCRTNDNAFTTMDGLEGLLYREESRFHILERHTLLGGSVTCILVKCLPN